MARLLAKFAKSNCVFLISLKSNKKFKNFFSPYILHTAMYSYIAKRITFTRISKKKISKLKLEKKNLQ